MGERDMQWQLVPVEPTEEMIGAYIAADPRRKRYAATAKRDWRAMLAAAPQPAPAGEPGAMDRACEAAEQAWLAGSERADARLAFRDAIAAALKVLGVTTPVTDAVRRAALEEAKLLADVLHWAESRCPCENDEPNPCPLCGASVENLEPCKSAERTLPPGLLPRLRRASAIRALAPQPAPPADGGE